MALNENRQSIQHDVLVSPTSENENMIYKRSPYTNSQLNPDYFQGNMTKIVNALNSVFDRSESARQYGADLYKKFATIILDTANTYGREKYEEMIELTDEETLIEAISSIARKMNSGENITFDIIVNALGYVPARSSGASYLDGIILDEPE